MASEMFKNRTTPQETTDFEWINMDRLTEMWDDIGTGEKDVYHQTMHRRRLRRHVYTCDGIEFLYTLLLHSRGMLAPTATEYR